MVHKAVGGLGKGAIWSLKGTGHYASKGVSSLFGAAGSGLKSVGSAFRPIFHKK